MKNRNKAVVVIRKVLPPILTIGTSAAILGGAYWYHQNRQNTLAAVAPKAVNTINTGVPIPNNISSNKGPNPSNSTSASNSTNRTTDPSNQTVKPVTSTPTGSDPGTKGDQGFSPVSGGVLVASPNPQNGNLILTHPFSSVVTQYGANPQTTFDASRIQVQFGLNIKFDSSIQASNQQLLLIPLRSGVLWAVVPSADASGGTTLYYTTYGQSKNVNDVVLSTSAQKLGTIPASITSDGQPQTNWYHPGPVQTNFSGNNTTTNNSASAATESVLANFSSTSSMNNYSTPQTSNSAANTGSSSSSNTTGNTTGAVTTQTTSYKWSSASVQDTVGNLNGTPKIQTISDTPKSTQVMLNGLYRVEGGAIITLDTDSGTWAYFWNEQNQALLPICAITNTPTARGWIAIGALTVYWGQRSLIAPEMQYYTGSQHMMDLATRTVYPIKLGSWTDSVVAGKDLSSSKPDGHPNEDNLYFRVKNTETWKEFIPNTP